MFLLHHERWPIEEGELHSMQATRWQWCMVALTPRDAKIKRTSHYPDLESNEGSTQRSLFTIWGRTDSALPILELFSRCAICFGIHRGVWQVRCGLHETDDQQISQYNNGLNDAIFDCLDMQPNMVRRSSPEFGIEGWMHLEDQKDAKGFFKSEI